MSKELTHAQIGAGANANDRECEHEAKPSMGTNKRQKGSQLSGAGSASEEKVERDNGMQVILGGGSPAVAGNSNERSAVTKSKTSDKRVQAARNEYVRRENGGEDTTGKK
jgi:alkaline phosphatase